MYLKQMMSIHHKYNINSSFLIKHPSIYSDVNCCLQNWGWTMINGKNGWNQANRALLNKPLN